MAFSAADTFPEINLDGFQVVKGDMFQVTYHRQAITLSIWNDEISFSKAALDALHGCERLHPDSRGDAPGGLHAARRPRRFGCHSPAAAA